jgi:16S rRNA (uracil1498-N3)-methyltransferase
VASERITRWERVAREAVQQSGALAPVVIDAPAELSAVYPAKDALSLVLHEQPIAHDTLHDYLVRVPSLVELVVGPEGGLSGEEVTMLLSRGFKPLYLGPRVLRTETAAIFALGAVQMTIQEHDAWQPTE